MSYIFVFNKNIGIFLILATIFIIKSNEGRQLSFIELKNYSSIKDKWLLNTSYIYYLDIHNYTKDDENVFQILNEESLLLKNLTVSQIDESILFENNSKIIKKETYDESFHIKLRQKPRIYYYEVLIKKSKPNQNYFVILIEPKVIKNNSEVFISVSSKLQIYNIKKEEILDGNIFMTEFSMDARIETFVKFIFRNISLENYNLILFVKDKGVSNFYVNTLTSLVKRTRLFIIEKNITQETDHIIYLSLLGQINETKFSIMLDDKHDLTYTYKGNRLLNTFLIQKINYTKDYYIFEDYTSVEESKLNKDYYLDINSIYGDYTLIYYEHGGNNITNIFNPDNYTKEILNENYVKKINIEANILKFSCKTPTFLKIKYFEVFM